MTCLHLPDAVTFTEGGARCRCGARWYVLRSANGTPLRYVLTGAPNPVRRPLRKTGAIA